VYREQAFGIIIPSDRTFTLEPGEEPNEVIGIEDDPKGETNEKYIIDPLGVKEMPIKIHDWKICGCKKCKETKACWDRQWEKDKEALKEAWSESDSHKNITDRIDKEIEKVENKVNFEEISELAKKTEADDEDITMKIKLPNGEFYYVKNAKIETKIELSDDHSSAEMVLEAYQEKSVVEQVIEANEIEEYEAGKYTKNEEIDIKCSGENINIRLGYLTEDVLAGCSLTDKGNCEIEVEGHKITHIGLSHYCDIKTIDGKQYAIEGKPHKIVIKVRKG
jgi:hypothetical protein